MYSTVMTTASTCKKPCSLFTNRNNHKLGTYMEEVTSQQSTALVVGSNHSAINHYQPQHKLQLTCQVGEIEDLFHNYQPMYLLSILKLLCPQVNSLTKVM